jgi:uncharacterized protein (TIGR02246 family)
VTYNFKKTFIVKYLIAALLVVAFFQQGYGQLDDIETLKKLNQDWLHSILNRDTVMLGRILAEDFVMITPIGSKNTRADNLETAASKTVEVTSIQIDSVEVRLVSNEVGLLTAWTSFAIHEGSKETKGKNCYQDVYAKRQGRWVAIAAHVTLLSMQ